MRIFVVSKGDSLYSIARKFGVSPTELSYINALSDPDRLTVGQTLVIPGGSAPQGQIEVNGYAYPNISDTVLSEALPYMTFLCPFSWHIDAAGGITPVDDKRMISRAYETATAPMLTLTNIGTSGGFSSDIAHAIFTDDAAQTTLIDNILAALRSRGYYGVNLNIEYVYPFDRAGYNAFLKKLSETLHPKGYYLTSAIAPKTSDDQYGLLYTAHDYEAHGRYCDRVIIMTYEWGYTYGPPMAVAPLPNVRAVLDYAVTEIPPEKILLGVPNYGYDWPLPYRQGETRAESLSNQEAIRRAIRHRAEIRFDETAQAPWYRYRAEDGTLHEVWFEDARSQAAKLRLVAEYGFLGAGYWNIMRPFPQTWLVLASLFDID